MFILYEQNDNNAFPEIRGTAYNFFNAITEYTDHERKPVRTQSKEDWTDAEIQSKYALFGNGADLKESALDVILEATANNPIRPQRQVYAMPQAQFVQAKQAVTIELNAPDNGNLLDSILTDAMNN